MNDRLQNNYAIVQQIIQSPPRKRAIIISAINDIVNGQPRVVEGVKDYRCTTSNLGKLYFTNDKLLGFRFR